MNDDLSRLLAGELDCEAAAALHARIKREPQLAQQWAAMQLLPNQLADLPTEMTPPAMRLPGAVRPSLVPSPPKVHANQPLQHTESTRYVRRSWLSASLLLAAGLSLGILLPRPVSEIRIARGTQLTEGRVDVLAGDVPIEVDGKVLMVVEPPRGVSREQWAEIPTMDKSHFLSALAGAVVTLTVVEGTALVRPEGSPPVTLSAGQKRTVGGTDASQSPTVLAAAPAAAPGLPPAESRELAALKLEHAITLGQLRALGGAPAEWPKDLPPPYKPDAFKSFVAERVASIPYATLEAVDCDEYPCIAVVRSTDPTEKWQDNLMPVHDELGETAYGTGNLVIGFGSHNEDQNQSVKLYAFSIVPGQEDGLDPDIRTRLDVRVRGDMEGLADGLMEEGRAAEHTEDDLTIER